LPRTGDGRSGFLAAMHRRGRTGAGQMCSAFPIRCQISLWTAL